MEYTQLKLDCDVKYYPTFLSKKEATNLYEYIFENFDLVRRTVNTKNEEGDETKYKLNRGTTMFLDKELENSDIVPNIWGTDISRNVWSGIVENVKERVENLTGKRYNICLCNYYATGNRTIGFHSDQEEYGSISCIASISLGEEREFVFRSKKDPTNKTGLVLEHGSLIIMGENCQERYEHSVPANKKCKNGRINLTFRLFSDDRYSLTY